MGFKQLLLALAVKLGQKVVQANLTHGTHLRVPRQTAQPLPQFNHMLGAMFVEVHRVQAKRGIQLTVGLDQVPHALPIALVDPQYHHFLNPQRPTACQ